MSVKSYGAASQLSGSTVRSFYYGSDTDDIPSPQNVYTPSPTPHKQNTEAWWSVGDILKPTLTHQNAALTMFTNNNEDWNVSDSLTDLYGPADPTNQKLRKFDERQLDHRKWLSSDPCHGFIRVFHSENDTSSRLFPCTLSTPAQKVCLHFGIASNSLHVQQNGDIIHRLEPFDCPLAIQNEYLKRIGYSDQRRIQEVGTQDVTSYLVKFYAGKPVSDRTYARNQLSSYVYVRKGKLIHQWVRRRCIITGTRLFIHRDKISKPTIVQLAKGSVEELQIKNQTYCLKITSTEQGERAIYLSFVDVVDYNKWLKKLRKATSKLPTKADLSNCHLEFLPETVFTNEDLEVLILRHNALRDRPIEEDIYTIGWLDDLPRFTHLQSLNLSDNNLQTFPLAVCKMKALVELNLACNKLTDIPNQVVDLVNLRVLHIHNNRLTQLPEILLEMKNLSVIVLAFNRFLSIPGVLLQENLAVYKLDSVIMAGNCIDRLPIDKLADMAHVKKIDLRMNKVKISATEMTQFHHLQHITHLDIRDNLIDVLDIRSIRSLEYLNCEHNVITSLQVNGSCLKSLFAANNNINQLTISPKAEYISVIDLSYNNVSDLPPWIGDCFFLVKLDVGHNQLTTIPNKLLSGAQKLKILRVNHNKLTVLSGDVKNCILEELHLEHNLLTDLPPEIFINANRLRYLNATKNKLTDLPAPNRNESLNKLQELYLTSNMLGNQAIHKVGFFHRLRVLHLANNKITQLRNSDMEKLEQLQELNVSSNNLHELPEFLGRHPKLQVLRVNSNLLQEIPNFKNSSAIKVLEVGSNRLTNVNMKNLMNSQVNLLDISGNPDIMVSSQSIAKAKKICMVDMRGQNRSLLDLSTIDKSNAGKIWQSGFSQTSGIRNKLSVSVINQTQFVDENDSLFGVLDGGRNEEISKSLAAMVPDIIQQELTTRGQHKDYLKYSMLSAHGKLKSVGQRVGAAAAIVHIRKSVDGVAPPTLHLANVGDTEVVLCRNNRPVCLSRLFTVSRNPEECRRICENDGIITEDGRVSGVTFNTRLLGCSYLYPHVIPDPHHTSTPLTPDDQLIIIANQGLWKYMSYEEAVNEVRDIPDPVVGAKRLQDLAQGYGSKENVAILVVRLLLSESERQRIKELLETQYEGQKHLLSMLQQHAEMMRAKEREESEAQFGKIKFDKSGHVKRKGDSKIRPPVTEDVREEQKHRDRQIRQLETALQLRLTNEVKDKEILYEMKQGPLEVSLDDSVDEDILLKSRNQNIPVETWERNLQKRLTEEVKDRELEYMFKGSQEAGVSAEPPGSNWSTISQKDAAMKKGKSEGAIVSRKVAIPEGKHIPMERSESTDTITSFEEFSKQPVVQQNIDRDAVLFHQMQLARAQSSSSTSIDSTQSDPLGPSVRDMYKLPQRTSAHSIEVLVHSSKPGRGEGEMRGEMVSEEREIFGEYDDEEIEDNYSKIQSPSLIAHVDEDLGDSTDTLTPGDEGQEEEEPIYSTVDKSRKRTQAADSRIEDKAEPLANSVHQSNNLRHDEKGEMNHYPTHQSQISRQEEEEERPMNPEPGSHRNHSPYNYGTVATSITSIEDVGVMGLSENRTIYNPEFSGQRQTVYDCSSEENSANSSPNVVVRHNRLSQGVDMSPSSSPEVRPRLDRTPSDASIMITYL